jgi:hypothetical protein
MRTFKDEGGRIWKLLVTVGSSNRVREATGVVLQRLFDESCSPMAELARDEAKLVSVLWVLCERQAENMCFTDQVTGEEHTSVGPADFAEFMFGEALGEAWEALVRSTADFFTSQGARAAAHAMLDKINLMAKEFCQGATQLVQEINASQVATSMLNSVTNGQASRVRTPTPEQPES